MKAEKKKELEAQLRKMLAEAQQPADEKKPAKSKPGNIRVIRRRRGQPDTLIA